MNKKREPNFLVVDKSKYNMVTYLSLLCQWMGPVGGFCWLDPLHFLAKNIDIAKGNLKIIPKKKHRTSK